MKTTILTSAGMLAAISIVFQIVHIGYLSPWGMWIDLVAIPWLLAYFIFGFRGSLITAIVSSIIIALVAPSGVIGGSMKFIATFPMLFTPALIVYLSKLKIKDLEKTKWFVIVLVSSIIVRGLFVIPANYYFAIPVFFGMSPEQAMGFVPPVVMFGLNAIQGFIDLTVAWMLAFRFKLTRFGTL
jgi:riboflavin transporter FmnP